ncbi:MAG: c-type cytochrome [Pseudomonadota bacterium]|nr:c-type cytochrome [Pseudomonadota bacterium]
MRSFVRYAAIALIECIVGALGLSLYVYVSTERVLDRRYPVVRAPMLPVAGSDAVERGKKLADRTGCTDCHRPDLRGGVFVDEGWLHGRYYASNLTTKTATYSNEELSRIVRLGVRPDGRGVVAMFSFGFTRLTDSEMAEIIAFLRSMPTGGSEQPEHFIGPLDRWELWIGRGFRPALSYVDDARRKEPVDLGPQHSGARHLSSIVCSECHGADLKGDGWGTGAPDLAVVGSYGLPELTRLLRTGIGADGKEHELMSAVAKDRLHHLSDEEIAGLHAYFVARAKLRH